VQNLLAHLYVLLPVLDDAKHYWVGDDEVERLLRRGEGRLCNHPEKELITKRCLKHQKWLANEAMERLIGEEEPEADEAAERSGHWHCANLRLASSHWRGLCAASRCAEFMNAFSVFWHWKANRSIRGCSQAAAGV
jgi:hypothetical protein